MNTLNLKYYSAILKNSFGNTRTIKVVSENSTSARNSVERNIAKFNETVMTVYPEEKCYDEA